MLLPALLSRRRINVHKNTFGHVLILAGSPRMLGAAALTSLAAMRAGAGLVTVGVAKSLNQILQKKISNVVMTLPLSETKQGTVSLSSYKELKKLPFNALAIGPGLTTNGSTQKFIRRIISTFSAQMVIDADGLNALAGHLNILTKSTTPKILTPHPGEMARLTGFSRDVVESRRPEIARAFAKKYQCVLLLKGYRTVVASPAGKVYINKTGNSGMATAGSGDVLTGMIAAFLAQGLSPFEAAKWGAYLHGKAGDLAGKSKTKLSMIASDIIDFIPQAVKSSQT